MTNLDFLYQDTRRAARHMSLALGLSLAVHGALLLALRAVPGAFAAARVEFIPARLMEVSLPGPPRPAAPPPEAVRPQPVEKTLAEQAPPEKVSPRATDKTDQPREDAPKPPAPPAVAAPGAPTAEKPAAVSVPLAEDPTYYPAKQLDVTPQSLARIQPIYPENAVERGIQGYVTLLLYVDELGVVRTAEVADAKPEGVFDQSALDAFRDARFKPAIRNGVAVKSRVLIRVTYNLENRGDIGSKASAGFVPAPPSTPPSAPQAGKGAELAVANKCFACHAVDKKPGLLGPPFREIAARYRSQDKAAAHLFDKLKRGMAASAYQNVHAAPSDGDLRIILEWITGLP